MKNHKEISDLLDKYYDGDTTSNEEIILYLMLLDEPSDSVYKKHLAVFEGMLDVASQTNNKKRFKIFKKERRVSYLISGAAAILVAFFGTKYIPDARNADASYINGMPIAQEEVNQRTQDAFTMLSNSINAGLEAQETVDKHIHETDKIITDTWIQAISSIDAGNGYDLTNYEER